MTLGKAPSAFRRIWSSPAVLLETLMLDVCLTFNCLLCFNLKDSMATIYNQYASGRLPVTKSWQECWKCCRLGSRLQSSRHHTLRKSQDECQVVDLLSAAHLTDNSRAFKCSHYTNQNRSPGSQLISPRWQSTCATLLKDSRALDTQA